MSQIGPGIRVSGHSSNGASQPPRNRTDVRALIRIMFMYSPRKNSANAIDEYSTLNPVTSEASSSGRSNGCRLVSARIEATKIMNIGKCGHDVPDVPLRPDDVGKVERARGDQHAEDDEADRDLVAHHLRRGAQGAEEGVARVRRPAGHDHAVDAERADREQVEDADVDVRQHHAGAERDHRPADQRQDEGHHRRQQEHDLVGAGRDHRLLEEQLEAVGRSAAAGRRGPPSSAPAGAAWRRSPCARRR